VVDEHALVRALKEGWIASAALDVFEEEPEVHPGLITMSNVVLVPHIGSATWQTRRAMAAMAARNLVAVSQGKTPPNPVS
jgi:glyoxylate reductase